jgi:hypothetical protein
MSEVLELTTKKWRLYFDDPLRRYLGLVKEIDAEKVTITESGDILISYGGEVVGIYSRGSWMAIELVNDRITMP